MVVLMPDLYRVWAFINVFLVMKIFFLVFQISRMRGVYGIFRHPEDKETVGKGSPTTPSEEGSKIMAKYDRAHANDLENLLPFFIGSTIWLFAISSSGDSDIIDKDGTAYIVLCVLFGVSRLVHTICLIQGIQPTRTLVFTIGLVINILINLWGVGRMFKSEDIGSH